MTSHKKKKKHCQNRIFCCSSHYAIAVA